MKIGYLGAGTWGTALANLLASNGHSLKVWDRDLSLLQKLKKEHRHPKLNVETSKEIEYVETIEEAIQDADLIIESVTSKGIRFIFEAIAKKKCLCPIILTSKGIEPQTGLLLPEIAIEILGEKNKHLLGVLSGPSHAEEVIKNLPTSVVCSAFDKDVIALISEAFNSKTFRVYPNSDILGVCFGGAMKNIIAIACGIADGLEFGDNTRAALMTRGLHEMRKLACAMGFNEDTLNGLSGLGDLFVTCSSTLSRNYSFGKLLAQGFSMEEAKKKIGMVVEGAFTTEAAIVLGEKFNVPLPITEATYKILYKGFCPKEAVKELFSRTIKEEHL
jgi:glycerol-3-phosphate dehydrogenase (NAD(P)+)